VTSTATHDKFTSDTVLWLLLLSHLNDDNYCIISKHIIFLHLLDYDFYCMTAIILTWRTHQCNSNNLLLLVSVI